MGTVTLRDIYEARGAIRVGLLAALDEGMVARAMPHGGILGMAPPVVITRAEVDQVVEMTRRAVDRVHRSQQA